MNNNKTSYGIACFTHIDDKLHILLSRHKCTYEFYDFLGMHKNINFSYGYLYEFFKRMTNIERRYASSGNFDECWIYFWGAGTCIKNMTNYYTFKASFTRGFKNHGFIINKVLNDLSGVNIDESSYRWSLPKGKSLTNERMYDTAIREFREETGIDVKNFDWMLEDVNTTILDGVYRLNYFISYMSFDKIKNIKRDTLSPEISQSTWVAVDVASTWENMKSVCDSINIF